MPCAATTNLANVSLQTRLKSNRGSCMKAAAVAHVSAVSKVGSFGDLLKRTSAAPKTSNSHHHGKQHWMTMFEKHWLYIAAPCRLDPCRNPLRCRTAQNSGPASTRCRSKQSLLHTMPRSDEYNQISRSRKSVLNPANVYPGCTTSRSGRSFTDAY